MSQLTNLTATREILRDLARIVKATRQHLATMMQAKDWPHHRLAGLSAGQFTDTLNHLEGVREGFILSQRLTPHLSLAELRGLVEDILLDWKWVQELNLTLAPTQEVTTLGEQLVVYNHALVALSILPRLPANAITFPQRRPSYRDVTPPAVPNETLARIEEIERIIYQTEIGPLKNVAYGPFRRTYAFFEASNWLVDNYLASLLDD
jgi:hypothetical protein